MHASATAGHVGACVRACRRTKPDYFVVGGREKKFRGSDEASIARRRRACGRGFVDEWGSIQPLRTCVVHLALLDQGCICVLRLPGPPIPAPQNNSTLVRCAASWVCLSGSLGPLVKDGSTALKREPALCSGSRAEARARAPGSTEPAREQARRRDTLPSLTSCWGGVPPQTPARELRRVRAEGRSPTRRGDG